MDAMPELRMPRPLGMTIHPMSVVDPAAVIGRGVRIGPFCTVGPDVVIEDGVELVSHVVVDGHTRIGAGSKLFPFCSVGLEPQDLKYKGEPTRCEIGARVQVRENCTIHRGTATGRGITTVGDDCMLMAVVHVAHDCEIGDNVIIANNVVMGGHVRIGDHAVIGGGAAIHQFVRIGRGGMLGGMSGAEADIIPFGTVIGNRGGLVSLNVVGLRRRGFSRSEIAMLREAYVLMFKGEGVFADRVEEARAKYGHDPLVAEVLAFIDAPGRRGLMRVLSRQDETEQ